MTRNKKGFTLVELVIVIAVIAILAGVMIAVFSGVVKRANESAELQKIKNEELAQKADDVLKKVDNANWFSWEDFENSLAEKLTETYKKYAKNEGGATAEQIEAAVKKAISEYAANTATENTSLTEAQVKAIVENALAKASLGGVTEAQVRTIVNTAVSGISSVTKAQVQSIVDAAVAKGLTADQIAQVIGNSGLAKKSDVTAVETKVNTVIAAINALNPVTNKDLEDKIIELLPVTKTAADATEFAELVGRLNSGSTIVVNWDAYTSGEELTIGETAGDKTLTIRGNKIKTLKIEAPKATIYLVADVETVNVVETAQYSVHVLGNVDSLTIRKGRAVIEEGAVVKTLKAAPSINATVVVALEAGSSITDTLETEYQEHGFVAGNRDFIYIENNGDVALTKLTASAALQGEDAVHTTTNVVITNGNSGSRITENKVEVDTKVTDDTIIKIDDATGYVEGNKVTTFTGDFAGGTGTEADPFLIVDYDTFQKVSEYYTKGYYYFKVKNGIEYIDATNWIPVKLYGSINGNNVIMSNLDSVLFNCAWNDRGSNVVTISNMTLNCNIFATSSASSLIRTAPDDLFVENVDVHGQIVGYSVGGYVDYGSGNFGDAETRNWQVTFTDCENDAHLVSYGEGVGGFVQHPYSDVTNGSYTGSSLMTIIDSVFTGKITSVSNVMDYFAYQGNHVHVKTTYSSEFLEELGYNPEGTLYKTMNKDGNGMFDAGNYSGDGVTDANYPSNGNSAGAYRPGDTTNSTYKLKITGTGSNPANYGDVYTFTKANGATTAKIAFMISPNAKATESGSYTSTYADETIDVSTLADGAEFNTRKIKYWTISINPIDVYETGVSGTTFEVVNDFYGKTHNGAKVYAVQYDANGVVVGITSVSVCGSNAVAVRAQGSLVKSAGAGSSYTYDAGQDLSGKTVTIRIYDRKTSTWTYTYESTEIVKTLVQGTDFTVSGSTITINNVEGIKLRNASLYDYFKEYCRYDISITD